MTFEDITFQAQYLQVSYFLTGEHRPYDKKSATFGRIKPLKEFGIRKHEGIGAWEIAFRYSHLDLDDSFIRGGSETNLTAGLNWYLTSHVRTMLNYIHADIDHPDYDGNVDIIQTRFQIDFSGEDIRTVLGKR